MGQLKDASEIVSPVYSKEVQLKDEYKMSVILV